MIKLRIIAITIALSAVLIPANTFAESAKAELSNRESVELYGKTAYPQRAAVVVPDSMLTRSELKAQARQQHRDSVRANKKIWTSVLGGPSYTPEASAGFAAAVLLSFKTDERDTVSQRSFFPMGVNASINGTLVVAGAGTLFFNENRFRIYSSYGFRNEPANFYGVGMDEIIGTERGDETTLYDKRTIYLSTRLAWEVRKSLFIGPMLDVNYNKVSNLNEVMAQNEYVKMFDLKYTNVGLGAMVQYDTRDDVATPNNGMLLSASGKAFGKYVGGTYNYQVVDIEYRQFKYLYKRAVIGLNLRTQISSGDVPFTELPTFGSPFDLRGFYWGQYRDKSMGYGLVEYRQMFGTQEDYVQGRPKSKFGYVVWAGAGTLGTSPAGWDRCRYNYGFGLRAQIQPRKNFRLDFGKGQGEDSFLVYFNMTEAF